MTFLKHSLLSVIGIAIVASSSAILSADTVIATRSKLTNGSEYSFQKLMTAISTNSEAEQGGTIVKAGRIEKFERKGKSLSNDVELSGLEPYVPTKDVINNAMVATNINPWQQDDFAAQGIDIGIYMTESGCADETGRTDYDRLASSQTDHSQKVFGIMRTVLPGGAFIYCRGVPVLPNNSDLDGVNGEPSIHIINRSNGGNITINYSTLDRDWDSFS